ncbi:putative S-layer protein [Paenibacillus sp. 598K]|uniref:glycosyl hydrolase family 28-related protein n=1 Tax=Paenibacillus sp. 598K TaxID=1117987 RepID=UPI000FF900C2|nr:glycosyl hydrolase family 28-related protein [Paenibacillus sp. 598K]GBF74420.1 putative S-layer protein [Paenibacillus sp. 598K]
MKKGKRFLGFVLVMVLLVPFVPVLSFANASGTADTVLAFTVHNGTDSESNRFAYVRFSNAGIGTYVTQPGDRLVYDVKLAEPLSGAGGIDIGFDGGKNLRDNTVDLNALSGHPATDLTAHAYGRWYTRTLTLPAGKTIQEWRLAGENDTAGLAYTAYYDNIRIMNNDEVKLTAYENGTPVLNQTAFQNGTSSYSLTAKEVRRKADFTEPSGFAINYTVANATDSTANRHQYKRISTAGENEFVFQSGDRIEYSVKLLSDAANAGGIDIKTTDGHFFRDQANWKDQNNISGHPANDLRPHALNEWYHRSLPVPSSMVGKMIDGWYVAAENDQPGYTYASLYDNLRVVRNGVAVLWGYKDGDVQGNPAHTDTLTQSGVDGGSLSGYKNYALYLNVTNDNAGGNKLAYYRFATNTHVFQPGDVIEYNVLVTRPEGGRAGLDVCVTTQECFRDSGWQDQNGISGHPGSDLSDYAYGSWYTRKLPVPPAMVGKTADKWIVAGESDQNGLQYAAYFDHVTVTNGGTIKNIIYQDQAAPPSAAMELAYGVVASDTSLSAVWNPSTIPFRAQKITTSLPVETPVIAGFVATDFNARGDGKTDDTVALQTAIDHAFAAGGGTVWVPTGVYVIRGTLNIPKSVTLQGDWKNPDAPNGLGVGTILQAYAGKGDANAEPFLTVGPSAAVRGMTILYPEQTPSNPAVYPATIKLQDNGFGYATAESLTLVNPYRAVQIGPEGNENHVIRDVFGTPLKYGISVGNTTDVGRIQTVKFAPSYWADYPGSDVDVTLLKTTLQSATALTILRSDWEYVYDFNAIDYGVGMLFEEDATASGLTRAGNGQFFKVDIRGANKAIVLNGLNKHGISVTRCTLEATSGADPMNIQTGASFASVAQFSGCTFGGTPKHNLYTAPGSAGTVTVQGSNFANWGYTGTLDHPAVMAAGGTVMVQGSAFNQSKLAVRIAATAAAANILGNSFVGAPQIDNQASSNPNVIIDHTPQDYEPVPLQDPELGTAPTVAGNAFIVVTDAPYNAVDTRHVTTIDNTAAFQKAIQAAASQNGGIVYVPPGRYRLNGTLNIPANVELRGVHDIGHHTTGLGSVLLTVTGEGNESATPFITLQSGAGVRGLTIWHPQQDHADVKAYPWTIQAAGTNAWAMNIALGNAYKAVDFGTHPSGGHYIANITGSPLREGIFIGNSTSAGRVLNTQFNVHFYFKTWTTYLPGSTDYADYDAIVPNTFNYVSSNLDAHIKLGHTTNETLFNNFGYRSSKGLHLISQPGGAFHGTVYGQGEDGSVQPVVIDAVSPNGAVFVNLTTDSISQSFLTIADTVGVNAPLKFFNSIFGSYNLVPPGGVVIQGGDVLIQQAHVETNASGSNGGISITGGKAKVYNTVFSRIGPIDAAGEAFTTQTDVKDVVIGATAVSAQVIGNVSRNRFDLVNQAGAQAEVQFNIAN